MYYEILEDGTIGRSTPSEKVAKSLGLTLTTDREIVYGHDGKRYFKGEEPEMPDEKKQEQVRTVRNSYLEKFVDPYQLVLRWDSLNEKEKGDVTNYRLYLLDYTSGDRWWFNNPQTFDEWKND